MFSKNLSTSILGICDSKDLSYLTASEFCDLSERHFGSIARGQVSTTVDTLEKICNGFERTPNDLLGFTTANEELSYRVTMQVVRYRRYPLFNGSFTTFPVCPRCQCSMEREYQFYCDNCGQKLGWDFFDYATLMPKR